MAENYNENHAATIEYVNDAVVNAWEKMKVWLTTNVDSLDYVQRIITRLHEAYRGGSYTTAMEYADAIYNAVQDMATALRAGGATLGDEDLSHFATFIYQISATGYEVCILGKSGTHYSVTEWNDYIAQYGTQPEEAVVTVITPYESFVIGKPTESAETLYKTAQWGNTSDNVTGLYAQQQGSFVNVLQNALEFHSLENTRIMLLWYNPEVLPHIDYDPNDTSIDYGEYSCIRFATYAEMIASGQMLMYNQQVYVVTNDENSGGTNVCYYWNGASYTMRWAVPRVANNITGSPAAEFAWNYKAWNGDERQWALPTINHLLMMYVYFTEINACLSALSLGTLPAGNCWSCQQHNANSAYCVYPSTGNVGGSNKNGTYSVVPVAAL